jgi:hypothetical protein
MATAKSRPIPNLEEVLLRASLHERLNNTPDVLLSIEVAAFFIDCHPKKLERWRTEKLPPFPVAMNANGKSGVQVQYRVGALLEFIRASEVQPVVDSGTAGFTAQKVVNGKRQKPDFMVWATGDPLEVEAIEEPFFIDGDGLVLAHGWQDDVSSIVERLVSHKMPITWMAWDTALAGVWQDERQRLGWLAHADTVSPDLRAAVESKRRAVLAKV